MLLAMHSFSRLTFGFVLLAELQFENIFPKVPKVFFFLRSDFRFCSVVGQAGDVRIRENNFFEKIINVGSSTDAAKTYDDVVP